MKGMPSVHGKFLCETAKVLVMNNQLHLGQESLVQAKQILKDTNDDQESELGKFIIETTAFIDAQSKG